MITKCQQHNQTLVEEAYSLHNFQVPTTKSNLVEEAAFSDKLDQYKQR